MWYFKTLSMKSHSSSPIRLSIRFLTMFITIRTSGTSFSNQEPWIDVSVALYIFQSLQNLLGVRSQHPGPPGPPLPRPSSHTNPGNPLAGLPTLRPSNTLGHHRPNPHSPLHPSHSPLHGGHQGVSSPPFGLPPLGGPSHMQVISTAYTYYT